MAGGYAPPPEMPPPGDRGYAPPPEMPPPGSRGYGPPPEMPPDVELPADRITGTPPKEAGMSAGWHLAIALGALGALGYYYWTR